MPQASRDDCIPWSGPKRKDGYGRTTVDGQRVYAHRVAFCDANNLSLLQIQGFVIRHRCDNPECINAEHLEIGSHADNVRDTVSRFRNCYGERHGRHKLRAEDVITIKNSYTGERGQCVALAQEYGVSHATISLILSGKKWGKALARLNEAN